MTLAADAARIVFDYADKNFGFGVKFVVTAECNGEKFQVRSPEIDRPECLPKKAIPLYTTMRKLSRVCYATPWHAGIEYELWEAHRQNNSTEIGNYILSFTDVNILREQAIACGGWIRWNTLEEGPTYVTFSEWSQLLSTVKTDS